MDTTVKQVTDAVKLLNDVNNTLARGEWGLTSDGAILALLIVVCDKLGAIEEALFTIGDYLKEK